VNLGLILLEPTECDENFWRLHGRAAGVAFSLAEEQTLKAVPTLRGRREILDRTPAAN
jgi:hypothetical protein